MIHLRPARWSTGVPRLPAHRAAVCEWLRANDVDPKNVYRVDVRGMRVHVHEYTLNADGKRHVVKRWGRRQPARRRYTVPLRTEPPTLVAPTQEITAIVECPTCGAQSNPGENWLTHKVGYDCSKSQLSIVSETTTEETP